MDIFQLDVRFSRHALIRVDERDVDIEEVYWCIKTGKKEKIGKCMLRFRKDYDKSKIECLCEVRKDCLFVITVTCNTK